MKTIVLPGYGAPVTFTPKEDSVVGILVNGRLVNLKIKANVETKVVFLKSQALKPGLTQVAV